MITFIDRDLITDPRAEFANDVCQYIFNSNENNIDDAVTDVQTFYDHFEENVRNVYELVDSQIPLFHYYRLIKHGAENWDFSEKEYNENLQATKRTCFEYYV